MLTSTIKYNSITSEEQTGSYNTEFLSALSAFGNRIMCRFIVNNELYQSDDIRFIKRYSVVSLLKSVMYAAEIRIDGLHDLKEKVITDLQFGISEDGINYYLVSFGSFTITDSQSDLAGGFTTLTAYDGMLASMKNYAPITYESGETNYTYFSKVAAAINLTVGSSIPSTDLMALPRIPDVYTENNTYRDILDDYAEILGGCILVKNGALELVKPDNLVITLDAGNLINFSPKDPFPLIDNLIFTSEGSITYKRNESETGTIIKIDDNRLIDIAMVDTYMEAMWNAIRSWGAFIPVEADSHGYMLFEPCDVINFTVDGNTFQVIWQSNDISITQGINETFSSDEPTDRDDDYFCSDEERNFAIMVNKKADSINTELIQTQDSITTRITYNEEQMSQVEQTVNYINGTVNEMNASLNENGLQIFSESEGDTVTTITGDGMTVNILDGVTDGVPTLGDELLSATSDGVSATRLTADEYFKLDTENVTLQLSTFYNSIHNEYQVGLFVLNRN